MCARVLAIVNGYTGALCLREIVHQGHEVVGVITSPSFGSDKSPDDTVIGVAINMLLPLYMPPIEVVKEPSKEFIDLIVSMHYPAIFKPAILKVPSMGCVNIHPSKLPRGRGMTPSFWYLYLGRDTAWTTLHYLDSGVDSGDVIAYGKISITDEDTGTTVSRRLSEAAWRIFRDNLPEIISGKAARHEQDLSKGSYLWAGRDWRLIRWERKGKGVRGQIRCFTGTGRPAYTYISGMKLDINDSQLPGPSDYPEVRKNALLGEVIAVVKNGLLVQTGEGQIIVTDYSIEGVGTDALFNILQRNVPIVLG
jgi:methionyl-tRNA formyltransferase